MKIKLCKCFFGGYDGCDCGSSGIIISYDYNNETPIDFPEIEVNIHTKFLNKLDQIKDNINRRRYIDIQRTLTNIQSLANKYSEISTKYNSSVSPVFIKEKDEIIKHIRSQLQKDEKTNVEKFKSNSIELCDIGIIDGVPYFINKTLGQKANKIKIYVLENKTRRHFKICVDEIFGQLLIDSSYFENYPIHSTERDLKILNECDYITSRASVILCNKSDFNAKFYDSILIKEDQAARIYLFDPEKKSSKIFYIIIDKIYQNAKGS
jgi:hypothetical protein